jgi:integrase
MPFMRRGPIGSAKAKKLERLRALVKFARQRKWLKEHIAEYLEAPEGSSLAADKMPFTDAELQRMYAACDAPGGPTALGPAYRSWGGEDAKHFIMISIYTGLRISDVSRFDITERLNGNGVYLRQHKTRKDLVTRLPDWLVQRLRAREQKSGPLMFAGGESRVMRSMAERRRVRLQPVFRDAGPFEQNRRPTG